MLIHTSRPAHRGIEVSHIGNKAGVESSCDQEAPEFKEPGFPEVRRPPPRPSPSSWLRRVRGSRPSRKPSSSHAVGRTPGARVAPGRRWWAGGRVKRNARVSAALRARKPWVDRPRRRASERHGGMAGGGDDHSPQRQGGMAGGTEWCSARLMRLSRRGHGSRASTRASRARGVSGMVLPSRGRGAACVVAGEARHSGG